MYSSHSLKLSWENKTNLVRNLRKLAAFKQCDSTQGKIVRNSQWLNPNRQEGSVKSKIHTQFQTMSLSAPQACPRREPITGPLSLAAGRGGCQCWGSYVNGEPRQEVRRQGVTSRSSFPGLLPPGDLEQAGPSRQAALQDTPGPSPAPCSWPAPDHRAIPGGCLPKPLTRLRAPL